MLLCFRAGVVVCYEPDGENLMQVLRSRSPIAQSRKPQKETYTIFYSFPHCFALAMITQSMSSMHGVGATALVATSKPTGVLRGQSQFRLMDDEHMKVWIQLSP